MNRDFVEMLSALAEARAEFLIVGANRTTIRVESLAVPVLGKNDFIANNRAVGRPKDLSDLDLLEEAERER